MTEPLLLLISTSYLPLSASSVSETKTYHHLLVGWLLNVPTTYLCISGTDLQPQLYVLTHWDGVYRVSGERQYLCKPNSSIPQDGREHWSSPSTQLSLLAPRKLLGITVATPRQTASAGGLNEVRGRCIFNHRWVDRAPSALAGNRSRGGAPDQRLQPKSEIQNHLVPKRCITHVISHHDGYTLGQKLKTQFAISSSHSVLTLGQPDQALTH